jgi:predicted dehydrogenase
LARAIVASAEHRLLFCWRAKTEPAPAGEDGEAELARLDPRLKITANWADLVADAELEAVIVAGKEAETLEAARQLATAGKSLLLFPRAEQGAAFAYELSLVRDDQPIRLFPVFPLRVHPLVVRLRDLIRGGELGDLTHFEMERTCATAPAGAALMSPADVDRALLADIDLLRDLGGEFDQITAVQIGTAPGGMALATVNLAGTKALQTTWSARGAAAPSSWRLTAVGSRGSAVLSGGDDPATLTLTTSQAGREPTSETRAADFGPAVLAQFEAVANRQRIRPDWEDLVRGFELVEAAHRSRKRRRTIDLHFDTPSERSNFKTQMTAIGCGVLMFTLVGMLLTLALGAAAKEFGLPPAVMQIVRVAVFAPLIIFLALQLLLFVAKPSSPDR